MNTVIKSSKVAYQYAVAQALRSETHKNEGANVSRPQGKLLLDVSFCVEDRNGLKQQHQPVDHGTNELEALCLVGG